MGISRRNIISGLASVVACAVVPAAALGQGGKKQPSQPKPLTGSNVFMFGGMFSTENMGKTAIPFVPKYEDTKIAGGTYQHALMSFAGFQGGFEIGVGARFGSLGNSGEVWGNLWLRYHGFTVGSFTISPGAGAPGLSLVNKSIGQEAAREQSIPGASAKLLGHLSPEVSGSFTGLPRLLATYRLHHRSGAGGRLFKMHEGHNAQVVGARWML